MLLFVLLILLPQERLRGAVVGWPIGLLFRKSYGRLAIYISTAVFVALGLVSALWLEGESSGIAIRESMSLTGILVVAAVCALVGALVAIIGLGLVFLRRSAFGRQLAAMKDSRVPLWVSISCD